MAGQPNCIAASYLLCLNLLSQNIKNPDVGQGFPGREKPDFTGFPIPMQPDFTILYRGLGGHSAYGCPEDASGLTTGIEVKPIGSQGSDFEIGGDFPGEIGPGGAQVGRLKNPAPAVESGINLVANRCEPTGIQIGDSGIDGLPGETFVNRPKNAVSACGKEKGIASFG